VGHPTADFAKHFLPPRGLSEKNGNIPVFDLQPSTPSFRKGATLTLNEGCSLELAMDLRLVLM
jgi:hypothetical protein